MLRVALTRFCHQFHHSARIGVRGFKPILTMPWFWELSFRQSLPELFPQINLAPKNKSNASIQWWNRSLVVLDYHFDFIFDFQHNFSDMLCNALYLIFPLPWKHWFCFQEPSKSEVRIRFIKFCIRCIQRKAVRLVFKAWRRSWTV